MLLYKLLKKADKFVWTDEADATLQELKRIISSGPILVELESMEPMLIYMAKNQPGNQHHRCGGEVGTNTRVRRTTTSLLCKRGLDGVQAALPTLPEGTYGVFLASRKLRRYFQ